MRRTIPFLIIFSFVCINIIALKAQESRFFMPREIIQAYENGTRSYDGKPGSKYWHNTVDYDINVEVIPSEKKIMGSEKVTYFNNSPDVLNRMVIRLYYDLFREANPRAYRVSPDDINEGVVLTHLIVNGDTIDVSNNQQVRRIGTNTSIPLNDALEPGQQLEMSIGWEQKVPVTTIRTGAYDSTNFFLAYWYPQVAVYDDIFGWDNLSYDFSTEFYNNLGNYDVRITVPDHFTVLSTGVLQNAEEVLNDSIMIRYKQAKTSSETVNILKESDLTEDFSHKSGTWHYKAQEVPDFSFALSDKFAWDAANQEVDGRDVLIHTFYPADGAEACSEVTANQRKMMKHFSEDMPGIPYPYPEFTTFISSVRGGGGMETPMMANNGGPGLGVTVHEMFHTYFPMYVRTNEKRFAWMDEGWADFNTAFVVQRYFQQDTGLLFPNVSGGIAGTLGTYSDLPLITSTQFMDQTNYGYSAYPLPSFLYATLHHHLGNDLFTECYREYIRRWAKKSPTPYDFFYTFEDVSGQDLSWFWKPWFFDFGTVDIEMQSFENGKLMIQNLGNRPVPIVIKASYENGESLEFSESASKWNENRTYSMNIPDSDQLSSLMINPGIPDADPMNNIYPPLTEQYAKFNISDDILGTYNIGAFGINLKLEKRDGVLFLYATSGGLSFYLKPISETEFVSLDDNVNFIFNKEEEVYKSVEFTYFGYEITGVKR